MHPSPLLLSKHLINLSQIFNFCINWGILPVYLGFGVKIYQIITHKTLLSQATFHDMISSDGLNFLHDIIFQADIRLGCDICILKTEPCSLTMFLLVWEFGALILWGIKQINLPKIKIKRLPLLFERLCSYFLMKETLWAIFNDAVVSESVISIHVRYIYLLKVSEGQTN